MENEGEVNDVELMRQQLSDHQRVLEEHTEILKSHTDQLKAVTDVQKKHDETITEMNANYMKLENTIFRENKETRDMMRGTMEKQFTLIEQLTGFRESAAVRDTDINKLRIETRRDIMFKIIGYVSTATVAGGFLYEFVIK